MKLLVFVCKQQTCFGYALYMKQLCITTLVTIEAMLLMSHHAMPQILYNANDTAINVLVFMIHGRLCSEHRYSTVNSHQRRGGGGTPHLISVPSGASPKQKHKKVVSKAKRWEKMRFCIDEM